MFIHKEPPDSPSDPIVIVKSRLKLRPPASAPAPIPAELTELDTVRLKESGFDFSKSGRKAIEEPIVKKIPIEIRIHCSLGFDYNSQKVSGENAYGDCIFCAGENKLYVSLLTGLWDCKVCHEHGNAQQFIHTWYTYLKKHNDSNPKALLNLWKILAKNRELPIASLQNAGLVYDADSGDRWGIPAKDIEGNVINMQFWSVSTPVLRGIPGAKAALFGLDSLPGKKTICLCAGAWDAIALNWLCEKEGYTNWTALGVPGEMIWKAEWNEYFNNRTVNVLYDADQTGIDGTKKVYGAIGSCVKGFYAIRWPPEMLKGYDIRDVVRQDGTLEMIREFIFQYPFRTGAKTRKEERAELGEAADDEKIPQLTFKEILTTFKDNGVHMNSDLTIALKVVLATVLSTQIPGTPIWTHLVGPPGSGKTLLLLSIKEGDCCYYESTLTPATLISGWKAKTDASLIPRLQGKTLIIKDFTEIVSMPSIQKAQIYSTLRGAFDGEAKRDFGNGVVRTYYDTHFSIVTGVTSVIFVEKDSDQGSRFLMLHIQKGTVNDNEEEVMAAMAAVGNEDDTKMKAIQRSMRGFIERQIPKALPVVSAEIEKRLFHLANYLATLRAVVARHPLQGTVLFEPQNESATRAAKQLKKLLISLALVREAAYVNEEDYSIVARVAADSCIGFNRQIIESLAAQREPLTLVEIGELSRIPPVTLRVLLEDLTYLTAIERLGQMGVGMKYTYRLGSNLRRHWEGSGMATYRIRKVSIVEILQQEGGL